MRAEWDRSWEDIKNIDAQWQVNLARSAGYIGAYLDKIQDKQEAVIPYGAVPSIAGLNKGVRLSDRLRSVLFADPPEPEVVPSTGQDQDADNAEFGSRILLDECGEGKLAFAAQSADAFQLGKDFGSGFIHFYVDSQGRGPEPVRIKAHPDAQSAEDPLLDQVKATGQPVEEKPPALRFVTQEGGLTDDRYKQPLKQQFLPKVCCDILTGRHVRLLPGTSRDIWDASGVLIGAMMPLGNVKATFPDIAALSDDELSEIVSYRPNRAKDLLPVEQRRYLSDTKIADSTLVFLLMRYYLPNGDDQHGSYLAMVGDKKLAYSGEWWDTEHDERLDLPVTQFKQYSSYGNPYGSGSMERLGPGNELLALMLDAMLEHLDRFGDAHIYVPTNSSLRPEQLEAETRRYLPVSPNGAPITEEVPDFPVAVEKMYANISKEMDDESGLQQAGQGLQTANISSARHFTANLQQVSVLLSELKQNCTKGLCRGYRIVLQQARAFYTIPQMLKWEGEDGAFHVKEFSGADLIGTADVRLAAGTFSGNTPEQKAAIARSLYVEDKVLTPQEYRTIITKSVSAQLALQSDPHLLRIKRQLDKWLEGPPDGWTPPMGQDQTGQPVPNLQADPIISKIFAPIPCDEEQQVAAIRAEEIKRVMASSRIDRFPMTWNQGLAMAYDKARRAAGIMTVVEQQQAQQAAAQQQNAIQQQKSSTELQKAQIDASSDLESKKLDLAGQMLDVSAATASQGSAVPA